MFLATRSSLLKICLLFLSMFGAHAAHSFPTHLEVRSRQQIKKQILEQVSLDLKRYANMPLEKIKYEMLSRLEQKRYDLAAAGLLTPEIQDSLSKAYAVINDMSDREALLRAQEQFRNALVSSSKYLFCWTQYLSRQEKDKAREDDGTLHKMGTELFATFGFVFDLVFLPFEGVLEAAHQFKKYHSARHHTYEIGPLDLR